MSETVSVSILRTSRFRGLISIPSDSSMNCRHGILLEASFAGNYQIYINFGHNINRWSLEDNSRGFADNSYLNRHLPNPFFGILPRNTSLGNSKRLSAQNLLRPNPIFQDVTNNLIQDGHYSSDQLQLKVEKRMIGSGGVQES